MSKQKYTPVECRVVDIIEIFATNKSKVILAFTNDNKKIVQEVIFKTWLTRNKEEFLILNNGQQIRLDKIISINEFSNFSGSCAV